MTIFKKTKVINFLISSILYLTLAFILFFYTEYYNIHNIIAFISLCFVYYISTVVYDILNCKAFYKLFIKQHNELMNKCNLKATNYKYTFTYWYTYKWIDIKFNIIDEYNSTEIELNSYELSKPLNSNINEYEYVLLINNKLKPINGYKEY